MAKSKLKTPEWILEGYDSEEEYLRKKGIKKQKKMDKTYRVKTCPKCDSSDVAVVLGYEEGRGKGEWECKKCKWSGKDVKEEELNEEGFLKRMER